MGEKKLPVNYYNGNAVSCFLCAGIESESNGEDEEVAETSVKTLILSQVARVIGLRKKPLEVDESKPVASSKSGRKSFLGLSQTHHS